MASRVPKVPKKQWGKEVMKALIDRESSIEQLADELNVSREHLSAVIYGRESSPKLKEKVNNYLGTPDLPMMDTVL